MPAATARVPAAATERARRSASLRWIGWIGALAVGTAALVQLRASLDNAHVVLAYLVLVLGASARGGRTLGFALSVAAFAAFNFFFVPPYHTFAVAAPLDWLVLGAFLLTSVVAAQLLTRANREAFEARQRAAEVDRLAALGAEALNAGRAEEALGAVADMIRSSLGVARCEVHVRDALRGTVTLAAASGAAPGPAAIAESGPDDDRAPGLPDEARLVAWVAESGRPAAVRAGGSLRFGDGDSHVTMPGAPATVGATDARTLLIPLRVRERTVGVLALLHHDAIALDDDRRRLLGALAFYAALGVERVRLTAEAEHADALREADRLKDALLASVSHDLRTPLTTIKALAHAIGTEGDERAITIEREADRLNRFVADLLDLSRLAGGALVLALEVNAAEDLIGAALQRVAGSAGGREIHVSLDRAAPLLLGRFDFTHALRVLVNLIENALKYAPADAPIVLEARRSGAAGEHLEFVVADRGAGVPAAERERIFDAFYRPAGSPADAGSVGLGLSIARRLAEAQGGTLHQEPAVGGTGSRFVLRLPAVDIGDVHAEGAMDGGGPSPSL